jgi:hypothetical protein
MGTKVSMQDSFTIGTDSSVEFGMSIAGQKPFTATETVGFSSTFTDTFTQTISKAKNLDIKLQAQSDGVDHGQDLFFLLLNPAIAITSLGKMVEWNLGFSGDSAQIYRLSVSELKNPTSMPPDVAAEVKRRGFTDEDFQTILSQDPFTADPPVMDLVRFISTTWTLPYEPPDSASCANGTCTCPSITTTIKNDLSREASKQYQSKYSNGTSIASSGSYYLSLNLKDGQTWTWTNSVTHSNTTSSSNSASVTVSCPSFTYRGPTLIQIYWDTLYGTFVFVPRQSDPASLIQSGHVSDVLGHSVVGQLVNLAVGDKTFHTLTNRDGRFVFTPEKLPTNARSSRRARLTVGSFSQVVTLGNSPSKEIRLTADTKNK